MQRIRQRIKRIGGLTLALAGLCSAALAFYAAGLIEGEGSGTTGKATPTNEPVAVSFSTAGITPGIENNLLLGYAIPPVGTEYTVTAFKYTLKDSNEAACPVSNIEVKPSALQTAAAGELKYTTPVTIKGSDTFATKNSGKVELSASAPAGCENLTYSMSVKATHT